MTCTTTKNYRDTETRTLREELEAAEREGGNFTTEEVRRFARVKHST